jgi:hypothetical protein
MKHGSAPSKPKFPIGRKDSDSIGLVLTKGVTAPFHIRIQNSRELAFEGLC